MDKATSHPRGHGLRADSGLLQFARWGGQRLEPHQAELIGRAADLVGEIRGPR